MTKINVDKNVRRVGRRIKQIYKEQEEFTQAAAKFKETTCRRGCSHCCYKFTTISLPEGIAIAEYLITDPKFAMGFGTPIMKQVYEAVKKVAAPGLDERKYFEAQIPCPFLASHGECKIYEVRPAVCRYQYVVSDPENCKVDAANPKVLFLNLRKWEMKVWAEGSRVSKQVGLPDAIFAPLPVAVSWGMRAITAGANRWLDGMEKLGTAFQLDYWLGRMTMLALEAGAFDLRCDSCGHQQPQMGKPDFTERPKCPNCEDGYLDLVQSEAVKESIAAESAR